MEELLPFELGSDFDGAFLSLLLKRSCVKALENNLFNEDVHRIFFFATHLMKLVVVDDSEAVDTSTVSVVVCRTKVTNGYFFFVVVCAFKGLVGDTNNAFQQRNVLSKMKLKNGMEWNEKDEMGMKRLFWRSSLSSLSPIETINKIK